MCLLSQLPVHYAPPLCASLSLKHFQTFVLNIDILVFLPTRLGAPRGRSWVLHPWCLHWPWTKGGFVFSAWAGSSAAFPFPLWLIWDLAQICSACAKLRQGKCGSGCLPSFYSAVVCSFFEAPISCSQLPYSQILSNSFSLSIQRCSRISTFVQKHN